PSLIAFIPTWEPCSMASPRLARVPGKQDSTPTPICPPEVVVTPPPPPEEAELHPATRSAATAQPDRSRGRAGREPRVLVALGALIDSPPLYRAQWHDEASRGLAGRSLVHAVG